MPNHLSIHIFRKKYIVNSLTALFFVLVTIVQPAYAEKKKETHSRKTPENQCMTMFENGCINWSEGLITATGRAGPDEDGGPISPESIPGAAKADAIRNLVTIFKTVKIGKKTVREKLAFDDAVMAGIEKTASDASVARQYYTSDTAMVIKLKAPIRGGFLQLVLPDEIREIPRVKQIEKDTEGGKIKKAVEHTGLVIDARALDFEPVLNPAVFSEKGDQIYGSLFISREYAVQFGVAKYLCTMEEALEDRRTGPNPIVLKGLRKGQENRNVLIIKNADAQKVEKAAERHTFLKKCAVIIVLGEKSCCRSAGSCRSVPQEPQAEAP
ncbi:MAG: hypothetical protein K9J83_06675 [Desulfarculaceae bacterium]|nr:hypothetical protein [Desulfarculaceae bacterium]